MALIFVILLSIVFTSLQIPEAPKKKSTDDHHGHPINTKEFQAEAKMAEPNEHSLPKDSATQVDHEEEQGRAPPQQAKMDLHNYQYVYEEGDKTDRKERKAQEEEVQIPDPFLPIYSDDDEEEEGQGDNSKDEMPTYTKDKIHSSTELVPHLPDFNDLWEAEPSNLNSNLNSKLNSNLKAENVNPVDLAYEYENASEPSDLEEPPSSDYVDVDQEEVATTMDIYKPMGSAAADLLYQFSSSDSDNDNDNDNDNDPPPVNDLQQPQQHLFSEESSKEDPYLVEEGKTSVSKKECNDLIIDSADTFSTTASTEGYSPTSTAASPHTVGTMSPLAASSLEHQKNENDNESNISTTEEGDLLANHPPPRRPFGSRYNAGIHVIHRLVTRGIKAIATVAAYYPRITLIVLSLVSVGMMALGLFTNFNVETENNNLWPPPNSLSRDHLTWLFTKSHFNYNPVGIDVIVHRNGQNVLGQQGVDRVFEVLEMVREMPGYMEGCAWAELFGDIHWVGQCSIISVADFWKESKTEFHKTVSSDADVIQILSNRTYPTGIEVQVDAVMGMTVYDDSNQLTSAESFMVNFGIPWYEQPSTIYIALRHTVLYTTSLCPVLYSPFSLSLSFPAGATSPWTLNKTPCTTF